MRLISGFVDTYLRLGEEEQQTLIDRVREDQPAQRDSIMEIVTSWMEEGMVKGRHEATNDMVVRLLAHKVGRLNPDIEGRIGELPTPTLEALGLALLDFTSSDDLEKWLQRNAQ